MIYEVANKLVGEGYELSICAMFPISAFQSLSFFQKQSLSAILCVVIFLVLKGNICRNSKVYFVNFCLPDSGHYFVLLLQNTGPILTFTGPGPSGKRLCRTLYIALV